MPSFSFTAPIITAEEEKQERAELDDSEYESIQNDIFGNSQECEIDSGTEIFSSTAFHEALEKIPLKDKKELIEAFALVPHLVSSESKPIIVSRCDNSAEVRYNIIPSFKEVDCY
jgi:hypothetical protein